jgi:fatty acid synthase
LRNASSFGHNDFVTLTPTRPASTRRLLDRLAAGTSFGLVFGGQGEKWLDQLADLVRRHDLDLAPVVAAVAERLEPVSVELMRTGSDFDPLTWADTLAVGESATEDDWPAIPSDDALLAPSLSLPGIALVQIAGLRAVRGLGLEPTGALAVAGHSQGVFGAAAIDGTVDVETLAIARLAGVAAEQVARRRGLLGDAMVSVIGLPTAEVEAELRSLPASARVVAHVRNGRRSTVVSGPADGIAKVQALFDDTERLDGRFDGVVVEPVTARVAFHHPDLAEAVDLVAQWAERCGLDPVVAADLTRSALVDPVDWVQEVNRVVDAGVRWILDLGPGDLAARLSAAEASSRGVGVVAPTTRRGFRELTVAGATPVLPTSWDTFNPSIVTLPDGTQKVETRFTRLTGRSPILLAGMTPTTVDPAIVAAAANAGYWAELAGGGQVTESIFAENVARLDDLLDPGRTYAFNSLFLDPYLWRLQIGSRRLVQKARANGSAVDAVVVTAGIPELEEAAEIVADLRSAGVEHVVFKPGTVSQIKQVLAIADELAPTPVIVQIEGGKAGGHHSEEDLDHLLIETYAQLRRRGNVVVCVGGGIGRPADAVRYLTGAWSTALGYAAMPLDGVLIGTAAMAALEATTSPAVKQLLVETSADQVVSGRSQLGAAIHEIDNTASRTGRLLDEVAGDLDAVHARRDEIVAALNKTAKPYFGDVAEMTYGQLLDRFVELSTVAGDWLDVTLRDRFHELLQRAEARLNPTDHGSIPTLFAAPADVEDAGAALGRIKRAYPSVDDVVLHPTDVHFFIDVCRRPGKPVTFVPIIDADVRQWWRSDSLWQAHDPRFDADAVCVIPGPAAVDGITRVDEPIADLLGRFEAAVVSSVGGVARQVEGRRRADGLSGPVSLVLAAPDVDWDDRIVRNPVALLGDGGWVVVSPERAEHAETGAALVTLDDERAGLAVPIGSATLRFVLRAGAAVAGGAAPVVEDADATLGALLEAMAGGRSADAPVAWSPDLVADHAAVTEVENPVAAFVPDVLVGLTWPAVFGALSERPDVVSGVLDLVHLDHAISGSVPTGSTSLDVSAVVRSVADTEFGRVVTVDVTIADNSTVVATLVERFTLRGRAGAADLADPSVAGGSVGTSSEVIDTPRRRRALVTIPAPIDLRAFAQVTGDHNPIHTNVAAARLAGLGAPIVHGMWVSAAAQRAVTDATGRTLSGWTARFLAPVRLGDDVQFTADRIGIVDGDEVVEVVARAHGEVVLTATGRLTAGRTAYVFPGQGIQSKGMGMAGYARSRAAKAIWDRADKHTRTKLGFSILEVVRENPTELRVRPVGEAVAGSPVQTFRHPDGVLFLTQFTQVAMAVLASAQVAELRESGVFVEGALTAGHSVGEYNALAAVTGVLTLEAVVEVVFQRGTVMHELVPRDAEGRSDYRLAAIRPSQIDLADDDVRDFVARISAETGEFLEVANENLRGSQYVIAGTVRGCEAMAEEIERRREAAGGRGAYVLVPGIDVPFHSRVLRGGVDSFRARLDELLPAEVDPAILVDRYVPNLVARPFALDEDFLRSILEVVPAERIEQVLAEPAAWVGRDGELARLILVELLAWQFASPVRWIETQDLFFAATDDVVNGLPGLGVERVIEVGVGSAPTLANIASQTIKLPRVAHRLAGPVEVLNVERDSAVVFGTDEQPPEIDDDEPASSSEASEAPAAPVAASAAPARATGEPVADLGFGAGEAARLLIAWWTKVRPDQLGNADSIESLCDGASSRRNQLLVDLGSELSLGAIDGAAEADLPTLQQTVTGLARSYRPLGPVLSGTISDHLKEVFGPAGVRPAAVSDRVTGYWGLGDGWATHVLTRIALATRDGASSRGDALRTAEAPSNAAGVDALVDETVLALAAERGVAVAVPGSGEGPAVDAEALAEITGGITDALADSARHLLARLGEDVTPVAASTDDANAEVVARVEAELGRDWVRLTAPAFDARRAVLIDDRWASAREDVVRIANGEPVKVDLTAAGPEVARIARWYGLNDIAEAAETTTAGRWADDVAVVTGASDGSIAASVVAELLRGGATVVATASSLDAKRVAFFKQLYRANARVGATLWVVPANMASFQDVDALIDWVSTEQTRTLGPKTEVTKPALRPSLLFPFAAGRVMGSVSDAGSRAEVEARILLWSVERLVGADWPGVSETDRLHVVLPGSPNRGLFGGDGAYGETKAALDAMVAKASREAWGKRVTLAHAIIGWVRGTGLMGGNDPLVAAVEAAGVRTWTPDEMAAELLALCTTDARRRAVETPLSADFAAGLENVDLGSLDPHGEAADGDSAMAGGAEGGTIGALPPSPAALAVPESIAWGDVNVRLEDMVVVVGAGELGPYGSSRTRYDVEIGDALSAAGVLELAWLTGLIRWDAKGRTWFDVESGAPVAEADVYEQYRETVAGRVGIRSYEDDASMVDHSAPLLSSVFLDQDLSFNVGSESEARALLSAAPEHTVIAPVDAADPSGDWRVTRRAGAEIRVPLRKPITRTVGGQIPTGFDPAAWGIPADMIEAVDRVALWNLVCTVDAFLSSGFSPAELMEAVHPARVANTQGTGMGGMLSMQSLYIDNLLGKKVPNDLLQEALPNVIAAHVVQSYVGSYGAMIHPVAACATTAVSVEEGVDKIRVGKADVVVAGGFDDLSTEGVVGFAAMSATADTEAMRAQGIEDRRFSRANDRRRGGFVESQGGGTLLLARGDVAARMGLPVLGVIAYAGSFGDGIHQSIPAPGLGALAAGLGGSESMLARALADHGVAPDDVAVISKHDTSTAANDPNESDLHERLATAIGRDAANPLLVVSQKSLTGHAKGGAAAFQLIGLSQVLVDGVVPPNRSLDCVDDALAKHQRLVWLREPLTTGPMKAGLVTSLGFGHVAGLVAMVHPDAFIAALPADQREAYLAASRARRIAGRLRIARVMLGEDGYVKPRGRRLGEKSSADLEAAVLLDAGARLGEGEVYACR